MIQLFIVLLCFTSINIFATSMEEEYLSYIAKKSEHVPYSFPDEKRTRNFSDQEVIGLVKEGYKDLINDLSLFFNTNFFDKLSLKECDTSKYMTHLTFEKDEENFDWLKVLNYKEDLSGADRFKQELCYLKENLPLYSGDLLMVTPNQKDCELNDNQNSNLEIVYGKGNKIFFKIFLCPNVLAHIEKNKIIQSIRYIAIHELFHLLGLDHYDVNKEHLMHQKIWLLLSFLHRPYKDTNKIEKYRYNQYYLIRNILSEEPIKFKEISSFLKDESLIQMLQNETFTSEISSYFNQF